MSLLVCTAMPGRRAGALRLAPGQVVCGPRLQDRVHAGRIISLQARGAAFNAPTVLGRFPIEQMPRAVVCWVEDGAWDLPAGLDGLPCPKVLLIGGLPGRGENAGGLAQALKSGRFDRVVVTGSRQAFSWIEAGGFPEAHWFPGLTFPFGERPPQATGADGPVRLELTTAPDRVSAPLASILTEAVLTEALSLSGRACPTSERLLGPGPAIALHGAGSDAGFGDLLWALASGAALVAGRRAVALCLGNHLRERTEYIAFDSPDQCLERVRSLMENPGRVRELGGAARQWFESHLAERTRFRDLEALIHEGTAPSSFEPLDRAAGRKGPVTGLGDLSRSLALRAACQADAPGLPEPRIAFGEGVPGDLRELLDPASAPCAPGGEPAALLVTGREHLLRGGLVPAQRLWVWDGGPEDFKFLSGPLGNRGYSAPLPGLCLFVSAQADGAPAQLRDGRADEAARLLAAGKMQEALKAARDLATAHPDCAPALAILAELAWRGDKMDFSRMALAKAWAAARGETSVLCTVFRLLSESFQAAAARNLAEQARAAEESGNGAKVLDLASQAQSTDARCAEAHFLAGVARLRTAQSDPYKHHVLYGLALRGMTEAARLAPHRTDLLIELGLALRQAGGPMLEPAAEAFRKARDLDPQSVIPCFLHGECLLEAGLAEEAQTAFQAALERDPPDMLLMRWLGHALSRQGLRREAQALFSRSLRGPGYGPPEAGRRRVFFVVQTGQGWPSLEPVYRAFAADPLWDVRVVAASYDVPAYVSLERARWEKERDHVYEFLRRKGIPYVGSDQCPNAGAPGAVVFLPTPYDVTRPPGWRVDDLLRSGQRICYIPYAIELGGTQEDVTYQFNLALQQFGWAVFVRSEAHKALFDEHCRSGSSHVVVSGHPKFENLAGEDGVAADPGLIAFAAGRPLILWTPHFDMRLNGTRFGGGYSTFLSWRRFLLEEFKRRSDLAFVIRPHPMVIPMLEFKGYMSPSEIVELTEGWEAVPNVRWHRDPDYFPALLAADALISDLSSLLIEFGISGKPVCYLHNPAGPMGRLDYELDFDYVRAHFHWATSAGEIRSFLDRIAARDQTGRQERASEARRRMGWHPNGMGARIKQVIEARMAEDAAPSDQPVHPRALPPQFRAQEPAALGRCSR